MLETAEAVARLPWVQAVRPIRDPYPARLSNHSPLVVWHVDVEFEEWPIPPELRQRWVEKKVNSDETWNKRPLVVGTDSGCPFSCGEVELAARLRAAGYHAFWISEWNGFPHVECWGSFCVKRSEMKQRAADLLSYDQRLRGRAVGTCVELESRGGHPDVAAWDRGSQQYVYLEYKGPDDEIKPKQNAWAQAVVTQETSYLPYIAVKGTVRGEL